MSNTYDDDKLPEGFKVYRGAFADTEIDEVTRRVIWTQKTVRIYGKQVLQPRLTAWYGPAGYTYSGATYEPEPMPLAINTMRLRCAEITRVHYNSALVNLYRTGQDSVAWHADNERELGLQPTIASVSLGATRPFKIKYRRPGQDDSHTIELRHGDLLVMSGSSQVAWLHSLPKVARVIGPRVNLTFRNLF